ncbi:MAG: class I SAM-dependent RNA methyltransferase [bacterium]|nr:class I SAM-dependent RNA methyltransferase [bacterium]
MRSQIQPCSHRPPCPGCPRYGEPGIAPQVEERLAELATRAGLPAPIPAEAAALGFRTRARLAVRGRANSPKLGIFQSGTHRIVDIPRCGIHHPSINEAARQLRAAIRACAVAPYADLPHRGALRYVQIVVERVSGRVQLVLVGNATSPESLAPLLDAVRSELGERLQGLWWNGNPERNNAIFGPHWQHVAGAEALNETIDGVEVSTPPGAFGQSHPELFESLVQRARAAVPDAARVLELYAGSGAIGLGLLARSKQVIFNELSAHGLRGLELGLAARPEAERARARVLPGDAVDFLDAVEESDCVIVDPPRRGLDARIAERLRTSTPATLVYVSCGLDSFLREATEWLDSGRLRLRTLDAFALFPYTEHVETLAVFERS